MHLKYYTMTEKLIELVRNHPCLYDQTDNSYKNLQIKTMVWSEIGDEMNESHHVVKKKWKSLRDNYLRYKKEATGATGQAPKKFAKWPWASQLQFLDSALEDRITERKSSFNVKQPTQDTSSSSDTSSSETPSPETLWVGTHQSVSPPLATPTHSAIRRSRAKKIKKTSNDVEKVINILQNQQRPEYDAVDHLFQSYAQTFKTFSKEKQIKAKLELANLFANLETEEMQDNLPILKQSPLQYSTDE